MRHLSLAALLFHAGCEGCDFSFGPIPVSVTVTLLDADGAPLTDRAPTVELCAGDPSP